MFALETKDYSLKEGKTLVYKPLEKDFCCKFRGPKHFWFKESAKNNKTITLLIDWT